MFFCKQHVMFIKWKYQKLQNSLQEVVNNIKKRQLENHISKIRDIENLYMELRRSVENFNHLFGWPILQTIVYISMNILLLLYTIIFDKSFRNIGYWYSIYIYILVDISVYLAITINIIVSCEKAKRQGDKMLSWTFSLLTKIPDRNIQEKQEMLYLTKVVSYSKPSFSAAGLFQVKKTVLSAIVGTLTTYFIVIVQFIDL
ncbi:putative gustatory receptor 28a [Aethina tumida]|uniref:putative gustatory receptor 28a n=1 Tax=Aethina tumida TaxID=116153 RepID=UPI0021493A31|nr:putative gustatory receptor 28a [Aethina tumida]